MQDYIAMVLIWLATEQPAPATSNEEIIEISKKIAYLQQMVQEGL
jgi:hypothetical protein